MTASNFVKVLLVLFVGMTTSGHLSQKKRVRNEKKGNSLEEFENCLFIAMSIIMKRLREHRDSLTEE